MVVATRYRLRTPISIKEGTFDPNGDKVQLGKPKFLSRAYVEQRNSFSNNELYIIDEEATKAYYEQRDANIEANALKEASKNVTAQDLVNALREGVQAKPAPTPAKAAPVVEKPKAEEEVEQEQPEEVEVERVEMPEGSPDDSWTDDQLKAYCDERGIKYHHKAKGEKLLQTIKDATDED